LEKKALGVSKIVKNMSEKEIKPALDGYKRVEAGKMEKHYDKRVRLRVRYRRNVCLIFTMKLELPGFEEPDKELYLEKEEQLGLCIN